MRLMTYNILMDAQRGRDKMLEVIYAHQPDVILLQEVRTIATAQALASALDMRFFMAEETNWHLRVCALTRCDVIGVQTLPLWRRFGSALKVTVQTDAGNTISVYGVHLVAYYMWYAEMIRGWQIKQLLTYTAQHDDHYHAMVGDFNTFAPGDEVSLANAPLRIRQQTWPQLGLHARWALRQVYRAGYTDTFRHLHPDDHGRTLPSEAPEVRLDYIFANTQLAEHLQSCNVITEPPIVREASDHLPVLAAFDI